MGALRWTIGFHLRGLSIGGFRPCMHARKTLTATTIAANETQKGRFRAILAMAALHVLRSVAQPQAVPTVYGGADARNACMQSKDVCIYAFVRPRLLGGHQWMGKKKC